MSFPRKVGAIQESPLRTKRLIVFGTRYASTLMGPLSLGGRESERGGSAANPRGLSLTPSPLPSPIEGEGKPKPPQLGMARFEPNSIAKRPSRLHSTFYFEEKLYERSRNPG